MAATALILAVLAAVEALLDLVWPGGRPNGPAPGVFYTAFVPLALEMIRRPIRHRWWALFGGLVAGLVTGIPAASVLHGGVGDEWAGFLGFCVGALMAVAAFAAITHKSPARIKGRGETQP
ncbi:hypothetical protein [Catenulispora sp. GP43]|uniref:hypothetical protein n=1 Tax=Catenulispora sp. GP43 TaxID=3156263 RepID=UPI003512FE79